MPPIFRAILENDVTGVRKLIRDDPECALATATEPKLYRDPSHWIYTGDSALHLAAAGYRVEIVKLLLRAGTSVNLIAKHRFARPLHYAADGSIDSPVWNEKRQVKTIRCLIDVGAEIDAQDKNGATALHRAVRTRCAAAVRCLLDAGADPLRKNKPGSTPFHLAVQNTGRGGSGSPNAVAAQKRIIQMFLDAGVKPTVKDSKGKSVRDSARSRWIQDALSPSC